MEIEESKSTMTVQQIYAVIRSVELGKMVQKSYPFIAEDYRNKISVEKIVKKYNLNKSLGVGIKTAMSAVRIALKGYHRDLYFLDTDNFPGLIPKKEYKNLVKIINHDSGVESARKQKINNVGLAGLTQEERRRYGVKGAIALGYTHWSDEEKFSALDKASSPEGKYMHGKCFDIIKIRDEINEEYHNGNKIRNSDSIKKFLFKYKTGKIDF